MWLAYGGCSRYYCRYEAAGDQFCGTIVSGIPLFSFRFAVLPPMFKFESDSENQILEELILTLFPGIHKDLWTDVRFGITLVSLCDDCLKENFTADHCIF